MQMLEHVNPKYFTTFYTFEHMHIRSTFYHRPQPMSNILIVTPCKTVSNDW